MLFLHRSTSITQQLMPIYNTTVQKSNTNVDHNLSKYVDATRHRHATRAYKKGLKKIKCKYIKA